jgi:hypothetical protein
MSVGSWVKGAVNTVGDTVESGWNQLTTGASDPTKRRDELQKPYDPNAAAFEVSQRGDMQGVASQANQASQAGRDQRAQAEFELSKGYVAPSISQAAQTSAQNVNAQQSQSNVGFGTARDAYGQTDQSRQAQQQAAALIGSTAMGQGPSVAPGMMQENAAAAAAAMQQAGAAANQQFGSAAAGAGLGYQGAATDAAMGYGDAFAQQQAAGQMAAIQGARQTRQTAEDAIRQQAALTAGARGSNIGAALLNAQGNSAMTMQQANRSAGQMMSDQQLAAQQQAAAQQRQAAANQAGVNQQAAYGEQMANLQTAGTLSAANIGAVEQQALGDARAAQLASQEQLAAQGQLAGITSDMRAGDVANVGAANALTQTGMEFDQYLTNTAQANADRDLANQQFNATMGYNQQTQNAQLAAQNQALNAQILAGQAERGQQLQTGMLDAQGNYISQDVAAQMELERLRSANANAGMERGQQFDENATANRTGLAGGLLSTGASLGAAAIMSDETAKDIKGDEEDHDFSRAKSKRYRYKDPTLSGADDREHIGPMAQELPKSTTRKGEDGYLRVDVGRLALSLASGLGEVQRELKSLKKGKAA